MYRASYFTAIPFCIRRVRIGSGPPCTRRKSPCIGPPWLKWFRRPPAMSAGQLFLSPFFLPPETPRFIGWIPPRIGKLLADRARDLIVIAINRDGQHFYSFLRANVPFDYPDRVARQNQRDSSIFRFLFFFFYKWKSIVGNLYRLRVFIHRWSLHVFVTSNLVFVIPSFRACSLTLTRWNISGRSER